MFRFVILLTLALTGCSYNIGSPVDSAAVSRLQTGRTTIGEVLQMFGPASTQQRNGDGSSTLTYTSMSSHTNAASFIPGYQLLAGQSETTMNVVTLKFDRRGILQDTTQMLSAYCTGGVIMPSARNGGCSS